MKGCALIIPVSSRAALAHIMAGAWMQGVAVRLIAKPL